MKEINAKLTKQTVLTLMVAFMVSALTPDADAWQFGGGKEIPLKDVFRSLGKQRTRAGLNDCSNKAGRYAKALREHGYNAEIVVVKMPRGNELHAIVKLDNGMYYDPTFGTCGENLEKFGKYRFTVAYEDLDKWGSEFI